jgi:PAS domain S-box-containing protein
MTAVSWGEYLDSMPHGMLLASMDGICLEANCPAARMSGQPLERLRGIHVLDLIHPACRDSARERFKSASPGFPASFECPLVTPSGEQRPALIHAVPLPDGNLLFTFTDADAQALARRRLETEKAMAEDALVERTKLLAVISHELRTPLNAGLGMLQLLKTTVLDREQERYVHCAIETSLLLAAIIDRLFDIPSVHEEKVLCREPFATRALLDSVVSVFSQRTAQKGLSLHIEAAPDLPGHLLGDRVRITQVLFNLVDNAIKYTDKGMVHIDAGIVHVGDPVQTMLRLVVQDTGPGIPGTLREVMFRPFVRGSRPAGEVQVGAGLGLSIVEQIVRLMGGWVEVSAPEGMGARFQVSLPVALSGEEDRTHPRADSYRCISSQTGKTP